MTKDEFLNIIIELSKRICLDNISLKELSETLSKVREEIFLSGYDYAFDVMAGNEKDLPDFMENEK